jgi:cytochrome P450
VTAVGAFVHPFSPAGRVDPYPGYRWLRANAPVYYDPTSRFWLLTRHPDCVAALRDPRFSAALGQQQRARGEPLPASMLTTDPPEHERLRAPGSLLLGPAAVRTILPAVEAEIDGLVAALRGSVEVGARIGEPLATAVLATLLRIPRDGWGVFADLARAASVNLDPMADPASGQRAMMLLTSYLDSHLWTVPADDAPLAKLIADPRPTRRELLGILSLIVVGGWRPLAEFAGNALYLVLRERVTVADADLAVDEVLRMEAPIPFTSRVTTEPVELPGGTLPAGARVLALLAAANRDPDVFDRPDDFVPDRTPNPHLGLGGGGHYCLGAVLVRRAGAHLLRRLPPAALAGQPTWAASLLPRRLTDYRLEVLR